MYVVNLVLPVHYFCFVVLIRDVSLCVCISPWSGLKFERSFWPTIRTLRTPDMFSVYPHEFVWLETAVLDSLPSLTTTDQLCVLLHKLDSCVGLYVFGMSCMSATRNSHCKVRRIEMW